MAIIGQTGVVVSGIALTMSGLPVTVPQGGISGWTLTAYCGPTGGPPVLTLNNGGLGGVTITNATTGAINISLTASQCQSLGTGNVTISLWRTDTGSEDCLMQITIDFKPDPSGR